MSEPVFVTIARRVPSQNATQYSGWRSYFVEKKAWLRLLREQLLQRIPEKRYAELCIVSHRKRLCDFANLVGGAKPIPDALIVLGYLWDDAPAWMRCSYQQLADQVERTEISITYP